MNARIVLSGATGAFQICIAFVIGFVKVEPEKMGTLLEQAQHLTLLGWGTIADVVRLVWLFDKCPKS